MKTVRIYIACLVAILLGATACDALEDESLREKYYDKVGDPITKAELEAAISVTQPFPNSDDKVEGDQYVVLINNRPDIPGVWYVQTDIGTYKTNTDRDTIIYTSNKEDEEYYEIYFVARSAYQTIRTDSRYVQVTNCFDVRETILTGATSKVDKTAKKTWEFWPSTNNNVVYFNGMFGSWKYVDGDLDKIHEGHNNWGGTTTLATAGNYTMTFEYNGRKMTTYNPDGTVLKEGRYTFGDQKNHGAVGELITTAPLIGSTNSWAVLGSTPTYWLIQFDETQMMVAHPQANWASGGDDWDYYAWYGFYRVKE